MIILRSILLLTGYYSVCLAGIARIIYTIRLDVKDLTFTNANPSIWNMVESQVGFVAANIPSMGPLFSKVSNATRRLRNIYGSQSLKHESHGSTRHTVPQRGDNRGFERMENDDRVRVNATVQPGSPNVNSGLTESIPLNNIMVRTNLEQSYGDSLSHEGL